MMKARLEDAPVAVYWDAEGLPRAQEVPPSVLASRIRAALASCGYAGPVTLHAYGYEGRQAWQMLVREAGFAVLPLPNEDQTSEGNFKILYMEMLLWALDRGQPGVILIITMDENGQLAPLLSKLRPRGFHVLIAKAPSPVDAKTGPEPEVEAVLDWSYVLFSGEAWRMGATHPMSFKEGAADAWKVVPSSAPKVAHHAASGPHSVPAPPAPAAPLTPPLAKKPAQRVAAFPLRLQLAYFLASAPQSEKGIAIQQLKPMLVKALGPSFHTTLDYKENGFVKLSAMLDCATDVVALREIPPNVFCWLPNALHPVASEILQFALLLQLVYDAQLQQGGAPVPIVQVMKAADTRMRKDFDKEGYSGPHGFITAAVNKKLLVQSGEKWPGTRVSLAPTCWGILVGPIIPWSTHKSAAVRVNHPASAEVSPPTTVPVRPVGATVPSPSQASGALALPSPALKPGVAPPAAGHPSPPVTTPAASAAPPPPPPALSPADWQKVHAAFLRALETLRADAIAPTNPNLRGRVRAENRGLKLLDYISTSDAVWKGTLQSLLEKGVLYQLKCGPDLLLLPQGVEQWSYVSPEDPRNRYSPQMWSALEGYLLSQPGQKMMALAKSRYGIVKALKKEGPPVVSQLPLGELIHFVQLAINRKWIQFVHGIPQLALGKDAMSLASAGHAVDASTGSTGFPYGGSGHLNPLVDREQQYGSWALGSDAGSGTPQQALDSRAGKGTTTNMYENLEQYDEEGNVQPRYVCESDDDEGEGRDAGGHGRGGVGSHVAQAYASAGEEGGGWVYEVSPDAPAYAVAQEEKWAAKEAVVDVDSVDVENVDALMNLLTC